jgi:hypothetical protein
MTHVLGRETGGGPVADLGAFLARDGSKGAPVGLDLEYPHVGLLTGKRGSGKSHTMGVIAEGLSAATGVTGIVIDPMGVFGGLATDASAAVVDSPRIRADALRPAGWCDLLDLDPTGAAGALLWRAADTADTLAGMREAVEHSQAPPETIQAVLNHLALAEDWALFDPDGLDAEHVLGPEVTVIDGSALTDQALAAVTAAIARQLYATATRESLDRLPWLLVDEAHAVTDTVAEGPLRTIATRGRHPGVSLLLGTQRPAALPSVAISQADLVLSHRLTAAADIEALSAARPTYLGTSIEDELPTGVGEAVIIDDTTESAVTVRVRERRTPHGGASPRASEVV